LKRILLKGIRNEYLEILSLMGTCDVFHSSYDNVCELCRRYSRGKFKISKNIPSSQPHLNPYQPCSQILSVPSDDHRDTLSYDATLPVLQYFQQYPIFQVGSTTQASQLHLPQLPSHKSPLCRTHIPVQSSPHSNNNKAVQYAYSVELQHLSTLPTSPTLLQEIHMRFGEVIDQGIVKTTK